MRINVVCIGKVKERGFSDAVAEYSKRIGRFCDIGVVELPEYNTDDGIRKEGKEIIRHLKGHVVTLEIEGRQMDSREFAGFIDKTFSAASELTFVIGGSTGISDEVRAASRFALSFSKMTFPHTLMRVILFEQIYRAFTILDNHPYHK